MIIGLTGNIGSGKSTVANMFKKLGATIIDADKIGHEILQNECYEKVIQAFGKQILNQDLSINREKLSNIVFSNPDKLKKLNSIMHPVMTNKIRNMINNSNTIIEAALLFEMKLNKFCNKIIVVKRKTKDEHQHILKYQMPQELLLKKANFVIDNNSNLENTKKQVLEIWEKTKRL